MKKQLLISTLALMTSLQAAPRIASSVYPLQQIANAISGQNTALLVDSYLSPHEYNFKPADAQTAINADILLWVGNNMMPQLGKYINKRKGITLTASALPGIKLLEDHDDDEDQGKADNQDNNHQSATKGFNYNPHLWLSTNNASTIAMALEKSLIKQDPDNAETYRKNLITFQKDLQQTHRFITESFESNPIPPYFVFHDAYGYFEQEFGLDNVGIIRVHPGQTPTAHHMADLRKQLEKLPNACLLREPQFKSPIVQTLAHDTNSKVVAIDPVGYEKGKNIGYTTILKNIAIQLSKCRK
ncbi:MAG: metal ABC transporter solute-binding protein, Zn/Mn family [Ostreibacterium sp.]